MDVLAAVAVAKALTDALTSGFVLPARVKQGVAVVVSALLSFGYSLRAFPPSPVPYLSESLTAIAIALGAMGTNDLLNVIANADKPKNFFGGAGQPRAMFPPTEPKK